jgi:transcriptional regulator with PAS, ATPase and Fis domain
LDEIGEIDSSTQVKLLRALGEQTIERVGSSKPIKVDVRVVAATNKDLAKMVEEGTFREDLYWRLRVISLKMPPLRHRKSDIPVLCEQFLKDFATVNNKSVKPLGDDVMPAFMSYDWPGNVRELRTVMEHGVVMSNMNRIMLRHLPSYLSGASGGLAAPRLNVGTIGKKGAACATGAKDYLPEDLDLQKMERQFIEEALRRSGNNRTAAAELLGLSRRTMQRKLAEMGMLNRQVVKLD